MSMMQGPILTFPYTGATDLLQYRRVKLSAGEPVYAGASDQDIGEIDKRVKGISATDLVTHGQGVGAAVVSKATPGIHWMICSEAISADVDVYAAANGKVASTGTIRVGRSTSATTADGQELGVDRALDSDSVADSGTTESTFTIDSDASTPKIALAAQTGGTGNFTTTLKPEATLSGNNAVIVPEADGDTLVAVALAQTLTNKTLTEPKIVASVEDHVAGDTLTAAESGTTHTNTGAGGTITLVLPAATAGLIFTFHVGAAQQLRIDPDGSETIGLPSTGVQGGAGKYLVADAVGEWVKLKCVIAGTWTPEGYAGTWTAEA